MKLSANTATLSVAAISLAVSLFAISKRDAPAPVAAPAPSAPVSAVPDSDIVDRVQRLEVALGNVSSKPEAPDLTSRLAGIEDSLAKLQSSFDGISLENASEERDALFRSDEGHLKADEYFAAGKFAVAGEGYLAFLEAHPDHPDAYDILKRARNAFHKAGYKDKAIWAQEELIKNIGERRHSDVFQLAQMEKDAGRLDDAIAHAAEASELATEPSQALWHKMYWAWYHQLRDGSQAGIDAYRQVQQEISDGGYSDHTLGQRVQEKIDEIERTKTAKSGRPRAPRDPS